MTEGAALQVAFAAVHGDRFGQPRLEGDAKLEQLRRTHIGKLQSLDTAVGRDVGGHHGAASDMPRDLAGLVQFAQGHAHDVARRAELCRELTFRR
jgi:hypothetical protein